MTPATQGQLQGFSLGWCLEAAHYLHGCRSCLNPHFFLLHTSFQKYIGNVEPSHAENVRVYTPNLISSSPRRHIFQIVSVILCGELHLVLCCRSQAAGVKPPRSQEPHEFPHNYFQDIAAPVQHWALEQPSQKIHAGKPFIYPSQIQRKCFNKMGSLFPVL